MIEELIINSSKIEKKSKKGKPLSFKITSDKVFNITFKVHEEVFKEVIITSGRTKVKSIWESERIDQLEDLINSQINKIKKNKVLNFYK